MEALFRILTLIRKELLAIFKDPRSRFSVLAPPIIQMLIFGYAATYDLNSIRYVVLDQDRSGASRGLLARVDGSRLFIRVAEVSDPNEIKAMIDDRQVLVALQIGQGFERGMQSGRPADLQVIVDGRNSNTAQTATGYVNAIVQGYGVEWQQRHGGALPPVQVTGRAWYNPNLETRWHMIPGLIGMITLLETVMITAMSVAREREQGTFDQLLVTPYRPLDIMVGKAIPSVMIGLAQATLILTVALFWFRIPFSGSFVTFYVAISVFMLAAVGIGLLVSSISATMQQAMLGTFVVITPFALLSGLTTPISSMPRPVQYLTLINPLRYAITCVHRVFLEGATLGQIVPQLWPMAVIAVVSLGIASWMFRHRLT